jgi:hypothetical protein
VLADGVIEAFRLQSDWCAKFNSPLYAELTARIADESAAPGPIAAALDGWAGNPIPDALVMRFMGAVHRLVLDGHAPALADHYPSVGGTPRWPAVWVAFRNCVDTHRAAVRAALDRHVQTNEVSRSAGLLGGFLTVAGAGLPLRLLEIGSSAGLNLGWDRYRYDLRIGETGGAPSGSASPPAVRPETAPLWGDPRSPLSIRAGWEGSTAILRTSARVVSRAGCDLTPIDVTLAEHVRTLESFVWADQVERLAQLRAAIALARTDPPRLTRRAAAEWLADELAEPREGVATVVFHSIMWWYLSEDERARVTALLEAAGARATARAPLAWLRMEMMTSPEPDVQLTRWPGGETRSLARADAHGRWVRWLGS